MGNPKKGYKSRDTKIDWLERVVAMMASSNMDLRLNSDLATPSVC